MGITNGRDLFSANYVTAQIVDATKRIHYVAIKHPIGDFFIAEIGKGQLYCFKIDPARIMTYRETMTKSFRVLWYSTKNYQPISAGDNALLEDVLRTNSLPKVNNMLMGTLRTLGKREKNIPDQKDFPGHSLETLITEVSKHSNQYSEQVQNITNYLEHLQTKQIVTPVREVSEFLDEELIVPDAKFLGDIVSTLQRVDQEHKKVTNVPITGKLPWLKITLILGLVLVLGGAGYYLYSSGAFSNFSLGGFLGQSASSQDIMKQYPTPEALKVAISQGKVSESSLPPDIKREVDAIKLPATPPK